ncbi:RNA polymerase sigma factor [Lentzea kentuckyensis]|uniref:RNA polymerase sigma factor n=1 Tax=Lentzea kentuckyensis TaxID=360086 RepID=UPI001302BA92|nr:sigma-70 family RNA polymerase sigma factor [Lentzea kentuckyensis]
MAHEEPPDVEADFRRFHEAEHASIVAWLCCLGFSHHIAEEAAHEALEQLYWSWLHVHTNKRMWVRTTAKRIATRHAKAERGLLTKLVRNGFRPPSDHDSGVGEVVERHGDLVQAVNSLPERQRVPFALHLEGFTAKEIAAELDIPERTAHHRISRARTTLRAMFAPGEEK